VKRAAGASLRLSARPVLTLLPMEIETQSFQMQINLSQIIV
jgi:hypothetical protein